MAKATLRTGDAPVADTQAVDDSAAVRDTRGRAIKLRTLSVLEEMRLLKMLGEYNSSYYNFCSVCARVSEIDGQIVPVPNSEREIEAIAARLGKEGIAAMMTQLADSISADNGTEQVQVKK